MLGFLSFDLQSKSVDLLQFNTYSQLNSHKTANLKGPIAGLEYGTSHRKPAKLQLRVVSMSDTCTVRE